MKNTLFFIICFIIGSGLSWAQNPEINNDDDVTELDLIEAEIQQKPTGESSDGSVAKVEKSKTSIFKKDIEVVDDLVTLENWSQLAIIHPRFQPKYRRFQAFLGGGASLNNPWFLEVSAGLRGVYHFSDLWGIELGHFSFSGAHTQMTKELEAQLNVQVTSLIRARSYLGAHFYFAPIYGKMSWFNRRIIPYDVYFTVGLGQTQLEVPASQVASTMHIGAGQIFAITRNLGLRWDITVNFFFAQSPAQVEKTQTQMVLMSLGISYFFPEVRKR
ncbi:MAG: outer membrane beta-barrel domain-containing protein [Bdellovibrionaceae bacterium]|nr:outer membrane beta-barrel domain-containing protein [Pseudobdellovibrionaceae bacterium]MDW8189689.1 outer membrane beta-barrel domain-containing protein [Pseudobdellovibrionaceae bacterium]